MRNIASGEVLRDIEVSRVAPETSEEKGEWKKSSTEGVKRSEITA
jgi:hypothetical protein